MITTPRPTGGRPAKHPDHVLERIRELWLRPGPSLTYAAIGEMMSPKMTFRAVRSLVHRMGLPLRDNPALSKRTVNARAAKTALPLVPKPVRIAIPTNYRTPTLAELVPLPSLSAPLD